jgi:3-deoxy-manno-octulosonate cytidylyltransferase (CMP-KDO synthetase)
MTSKKVLGIIPARYGSTRFPGKPLALIAGKTLLQRTYENALQACKLDSLYVATDDQRIFDHVHSFNGKAVMTSSACLTGTDRLAEVLIQYPEWQQASVLVNIQGDEPCIDPRAIDLVADLLLQDQAVEMATLVTKLDIEEFFNPSIVKCVLDQQGYALYFSRSLIPFNRKIPFDPLYPYLRHIGVYAYRPSFLLTYHSLPATPLQLMEDLEQLKALEHGYKIKTVIVDHVNIDVNHPEDLKKVEQWICKENIFL